MQERTKKKREEEANHRGWTAFAALCAHTKLQQSNLNILATQAQVVCTVKQGPKTSIITHDFEMCSPMYCEITKLMSPLQRAYWGFAL